MVLSEARVGRGTMALSGCPREHRVAHETFPSIPPRILTLEPVRAARQPSNVRVPASGLRGGAPRLCCLWHQMLGLQLLSFFHRIRAIAAILWASVSRALAGSIPLATRIS